MELNLGHRGATRQSWREKDVRELVIRLVEANPRTTREGLIKLFIEQMREDDEYMHAAADYAVTNSLNALEAAKVREKRAQPAAKAQATAELNEAVASIKNQILMLNHIMPNGKKMRFCTGAEMVKMGTEGAKECAAWVRIGKKAGRKLVGQALSEDKVKALFKA